MFGSIPQPTPFDLHWRMFGIEVRVHPLFWLMSALLGWSVTKWGMEFLLIWILCVFVSILIHEMGHVLMGRLFGADGHILLYSFGGLAIGSNGQDRRWQRILVDLGGVIAQFILYGLVRVAEKHLGVVEPSLSPRANFTLHESLDMLLHINLFWPLLNLLPIWPLDGGQVCRELSEAGSRQQGVLISLGISVAVAGALAVEMLLRELGKSFIPYFPDFRGMYTAIFFALLAVGSFQALQAEKSRSRWRDDERLPWE